MGVRSELVADLFDGSVLGTVETQSLVECGVSCSKLQTCPGVRYQSGLCERMRPLPCIPSDLLSADGQTSSEVYFKLEVTETCPKGRE